MIASPVVGADPIVARFATEAECRRALRELDNHTVLTNSLSNYVKLVKYKQ